MRFKQTWRCDVLVLGAGIAGLSAAVAAAEKGRTVTLACAGGLFSGSSFSPGTWGLGLIAPLNDQDAQDLCDTIERVGGGIADKPLVETFVAGIRPAVKQLQDMGAELLCAKDKQQKEFIPCFDHKQRDWYGLVGNQLRRTYTKALMELHVQISPFTEGVQLLQREGRVCGALLLQGNEWIYCGARSVILATGGCAGLFSHHLCPDDVTGTGQALALEAGAHLVNMEFMQIMPGYFSPAKGTVFNEKVFRHARFFRQDGSVLFPTDPSHHALLEERSGYGPFTSRLPSRAVDFLIHQYEQNHPQGVSVMLEETVRRNPPEFVQTYFRWLEEAHGLTPQDEIHLGLFAHASNGGIKIDENAFTGVPGLYAAGEVTGGMHGADRLGGLSSANGLVFGEKAGIAAAQSCQGVPLPPEEWEMPLFSGDNQLISLERLQSLMSKCAFLNRTEAGLREGLASVQHWRTSLVLKETTDFAEAALLRRRLCQLTASESILQGALLRQESRGSHYRGDFPTEQTHMARPVEITMNNGVVRAAWTDGERS